MDEDLFPRNAQGISKFYHEILLLKKILQTEPQIKNMNINYYDLQYTVTKTGDDQEIVDNQYENVYSNFNEIIPNHIISIKPR